MVKIDRIYVDTNVYVSLVQPEEGKWQSFTDLAAFLFHRIRQGEFTLVISDHVIEEFSKYRDIKEIQEILDGIESDNLIEVKTTYKDKQKAREFSSTNYPDALHVALALKANAVVLVTRDSDFAEFEDFIEICFPDEL